MGVLILKGTRNGELRPVGELRHGTHIYNNHGLLCARVDGARVVSPNDTTIGCFRHKSGLVEDMSGGRIRSRPFGKIGDAGRLLVGDATEVGLKFVSSRDSSSPVNVAKTVKAAALLIFFRGERSRLVQSRMRPVRRRNVPLETVNGVRRPRGKVQKPRVKLQKQ